MNIRNKILKVSVIIPFICNYLDGTQIKNKAKEWYPLSIKIGVDYKFAELLFEQGCHP